MSPPQSYFSNYKAALTALSARTRTPLPSLILSFGLLHELTAIVPLVSVFYGSRTLGIGETVISSIISNPTNEGTLGVKKVVRNWVEEGDAWAGRVGRRYGVFGYEKRAPGASDPPIEPSQVSSHLAGDVANAIVAYGALLPVRVGLSLYLSPVFSRRIIEPIRKTLIQPFRRNQ
ncbi:hypothetical protein DXG01_004979 [Tephrocybe rancida]|nr:hypothetical protein DXG01_004979 [Tephrocybe rancida]